MVRPGQYPAPLPIMLPGKAGDPAQMPAEVPGPSPMGPAALYSSQKAMMAGAAAPPATCSPLGGDLLAQQQQWPLHLLGPGVAPMPGFKQPVGLPARDVPALPSAWHFPPQPVADFSQDDGPASVARQLQPSVIALQAVRPCPNTDQYIHRAASRRMEQQAAQPRHSSDICGWVMAGGNWMEHWEANDAESENMGIHHNELRLVYQHICGWTLTVWESQQAFEEGKTGRRGAPRACSWFDLRKAHNVYVEYGDEDSDVVPHTITVMMNGGNYYFSVEFHEDVAVWFTAIKSVIQDASIAAVRKVDAPLSQKKRWIAACGCMRVLASGGPLGERALAVLFHAFDVDYNCQLRLGEIIVLIQEMIAARMAIESRAEGQDRDVAIECSRGRCSEDELFDRAMVFRGRLDTDGNGVVTKDEFLLRGLDALCEALNISGGPAQVADEGYEL